MPNHDHPSAQEDQLVTVQDLTTAEVASLFGVCKQAVRHWANHGKLPTTWIQGRRRFPARAVAELAQRHYVPDWPRRATATHQEPV